ncbi:MAG: hypothetical protein M0C28_18665 [Candidatus Moduliflexus flocculans]|nr:hypothetical protein [Candidatus Moduliflexus flocculans]
MKRYVGLRHRHRHPADPGKCAQGDVPRRGRRRRLPGTTRRSMSSNASAALRFGKEDGVFVPSGTLFQPARPLHPLRPAATRSSSTRTPTS